MDHCQLSLNSGVQIKQISTENEKQKPTSLARKPPHDITQTKLKLEDIVYRTRKVNR